MNISIENSVINLDYIKKGLTLDIISEGTNAIYKIDENIANENGEATLQILEGRSYDYEFSDTEYRLRCSINGIISPTNKKEHRGRIVPNIYVGTLQLEIFKSTNSRDLFKIALEVLATKFNNKPDKSYRENYRTMLENITEKCTDLLMQINSPILQNFETDFNEDNETIYQRFCFVNSLINSREFEEAIQKIISSPKTIWTNEIEQSDIRKIKRFSSNEIRQLTSSSNRVKLNNNHFLISKGINSIPSKIYSTKKNETIDNAENRFVKHALEVYLSFCEKCFYKFYNGSREKKEAELLIKKLETQINQPFFKEISRPLTLKLNSPVLQRKSGYREVLKTWLMFDLAAKLVWKGGDDVYAAGKKDIATLYEYWLFFALYDLFNSKFQLNKIEHNDLAYKHLIEEDNGSLNVIVKSGIHTALSGIYTTENRKLNIKFSYNRTFKGGKIFSQDKGDGSWTTTLRPDYTLSIWPVEFTEKEAEEKELIVHIHFDAKYKVSQFTINSEENSKELEEEEKNERKGYYKNADLLKMHAYKDAIRRTGGAYILYPGTKVKELRGFHEIIPGLGAFAINPSEEKVGLKNLSDFIDKVIDHLLDRSSQRENLSSKTYSIYKEPKKDNDFLKESMPEYVNGKKLIPDETYVLVGFYKSETHLKWILNKNLYNFRTGTNKGSLNLNEKIINAKYLLLHGSNELNSNKIYQLSDNGVKIFSKEDMIRMNYDNPKGELYIIFEIEKEASNEFNNFKFKINKIPNFQSFRNSAKPYIISLKELFDISKEI